LVPLRSREGRLIGGFFHFPHPVQGAGAPKGTGMYNDTIDQFAETAAKKVRAIADNPLGFFIASMMAGAYVGLAIIAIFSIGQGLDPSVRSLGMGLTFGLALTLVVFAGAELFTGHTMIMTFGVLRGKATAGGLASSWIMTWLGNLLGAVLVATLFWLGGGGAVLKSGADLIFTIADAKMHAAPLALVAKGILCNWLVCLGIWMAARTSNDAAKLIVLFWVLFAFIASGFEHSVANMTVFAIALLAPHPDTITIGGAFYNLVWVTLGNIIAGVVFVGAGYVLSSGRARTASIANSAAVPAE
jgi:nitrite transporter